MARVLALNSSGDAWWCLAAARGIRNGRRDAVRGPMAIPFIFVEAEAVKSTDPSLTLRHYFAGLTEFVFQTQLGVADTSLTDYVSDLLFRFVRLDAIFTVRDLSGRPVTQVADMLREANERVGPSRRAVHRHIGDFTLFWAGLYPEALRQMQSPLKKDHFVDYCSHGKRAYFVASTIKIDEEDEASGPVLECMSHQFDLCAYGLREVRREWERDDEGDDIPRPLLLN